MPRVLLLAILLASACSDSSSPSTPTTPSQSALGFFVTSQTSTTGNLGGLAGADATCQRLAAAVGAGNRTWRAYLSVARDSTNNLPANARAYIQYLEDRSNARISAIGVGPERDQTVVLHDLLD